MHDINLNVGGLFGGIAGLVAGVVLMFVMRDGNGPPTWGPKLAIFGVIGGAFAGNFLWGLVLRKEEEADDNHED